MYRTGPLLLSRSVVIRLLHTADWHLGATLHGWSREIEHRAALAQLVKIAQAQAVHGVIVAGDVFDSLNPSAEAQRLLYETLRDLRAACPNAAIVLIAGNHDPAARLEAPRALFDFIHVVSIGVISREQDELNLRHHLIPLYDELGQLRASILALPYPRAADLPLGSSATQGSPLVEAVRVLYRDAIQTARRQNGAHPLILTGHLHIAGGLESEGAERRILIGGEHAAPSDIFPDDVAYVALGHLHRPQSVGRANIRYAGSLIPMSKTEICYEHGVSLVEIDATGASHIVHMPFIRRIDHLRLPISGSLTVSQLESELSHLCKDIHVSALELAPFLHLTLLIDGPATGIKAEVDAICDKFPVRLVSLNFERQSPASAALPAPQRLADCAPEALFRRAFVKTHGVEPNAEHLKCFDSLAQES